MSPIPSTSSAIKIPNSKSSGPLASLKRFHKNQNETLMTLNQQLMEIPKWTTPLFSCEAQE
jgi:hypothetical protein